MPQATGRLWQHIVCNLGTLHQCPVPPVPLASNPLVFWELQLFLGSCKD